MKKIRNNLFILIFMLFISIINLSNKVAAAPVAKQKSNLHVIRLDLQSINENTALPYLEQLSCQGELPASEQIEITPAISGKMAIPNHLNVTVSDYVINLIRYEDFYLEAKKINTDVGPAYCLEVEKDYPSDQTFEFEGKPAREIVGMMAAGYPNKSAAELGVASDDDAYFATQMAVWCVTEGYEPSKFKHKDKALMQAIKNIYNEGMQYTGNDLDHTAMEYYYSDNIQRIVVYINKPIETPDERTGGGNDIVPDVPTWPEVPDDEEDSSENVVVPGLG